MSKAIIEVLHSLSHAILSRATLLFINILCASLLLPTDYGAFSYILITVSSIATLSSLGVGVTCNMVTSRYYKEDSERVSATLTISQIVNIFLSFILTSIFLYLTADSLSSFISPYYLAFLYFIVSLSMTAYAAHEGILYGSGGYRLLFTTSAVLFPCTIVIIYILSSTFGFIGSVVALVLYRLISYSTVSLVVKKRLLVSFSLNALKKYSSQALNSLAKSSLPIALAGILSGPVITFLSTYLVRIEGFERFGHFSYVYNFYLVCCFIPGAASHYFLSKFGSDGAGKKGIMGRSILVTFIYGVVVCVLFLLLFKYVANILNASFSVSDAMILYMSISIIFYSMSTSFLGYWPAIGRSYLILCSQFLWAMTVTICVFILGRKVGVESLAMGLMLGNAIQLIFNFFMLASLKILS